MKAEFKVVNIGDFTKRINDVKRETGRDSEEMLKYVMILMLTAGRNATPLGKKNRALVTREQEVERDIDLEDAGLAPNTPGKVQFFRVYKQGNHIPRKVFVPIVPRRRKKNEAERQAVKQARAAIIQKFKPIDFRGISKASWGWAMKMLNTKRLLAGADDAIAEKARRNPIEVNKQLTGNSPFIEIINKLGWILKIAPGIEQRMMASADARLQAWLERRWQTGINRAERRSA